MGDYDHLVGELKPGDQGWLPLDEAGIPSGPATLKPPPELNAKAAHVMHVIEPDEDEDILVSSTGAPLVPPLNSNVDKRTTPGVPEVPPVLNSLEPSTAECGSADFTLVFAGSGFTPNSVIVFNNFDEPTVFVSENSVTTIVKPSLFVVAAEVDSYIRNGDVESEHKLFTFTEPAARRAGMRR